MGLEKYLVVKASRLTRKTCETVVHAVRKQILDDTLPDGLSEENFQLKQICASLLSGQYKLYETRSQVEFSNLWTDHGYELVDPNAFEFPGLLKDKMREQMTSVGKYQVVLFWKRESHQYVVAVRGSKDLKDFLTDIRFLVEMVHESERVKHLRDFVRGFVDCVGAQNVVLTGHSLGAGLAMIVGQGLHLNDNITGLKEFYFNPPHMSLERLVSDLCSTVGIEMFVFNTTIHCLGLSGVQAKVCEFLKRTGASVLGYDLNKGPEMETFLKLRGWCPYICINKYDRICNGYVDFFHNVESLSGTTTRDAVNAVTAATSPLKLLGLEAKPHLLFPSANLITTDKSFGTLCAHKLSHWPSLERSRIEYKQVRGFSGVNW